MGTPNREPQEYSRYIIGIYLPGSLYSITFLLYCWGFLFGVPMKVPLMIHVEVDKSASTFSLSSFGKGTIRGGPRCLW